MSSPDSTAHWCLLFSAAATHRSWPIQSPTFRRCFDDLPMLPTMRNIPVPIAVGGGITVGAIGATVEAAGTIEAGGSPLPSHVIDVLRPLCSGLLQQTGAVSQLGVSLLQELRLPGLRRIVHRSVGSSSVLVGRWLETS